MFKNSEFPHSAFFKMFKDRSNWNNQIGARLSSIQKRLSLNVPVKTYNTYIHTYIAFVCAVLLLNILRLSAIPNTDKHCQVWVREPKRAKLKFIHLISHSRYFCSPLLLLILVSADSCWCYYFVRIRWKTRTSYFCLIPFCLCFWLSILHTYTCRAGVLRMSVPMRPIITTTAIQLFLRCMFVYASLYLSPPIFWRLCRWRRNAINFVLLFSLSSDKIFLFYQLLNVYTVRKGYYLERNSMHLIIGTYCKHGNAFRSVVGTHTAAI